MSVVSPSGAVAWPKQLQNEEFDDYRAQVSQVFEQKARTGQIPAADRRELEQLIETMVEDLKADIRKLRPQDYVAVKSFARSLLAELQTQPSHADEPIAPAKFAQE